MIKSIYKIREKLTAPSRFPITSRKVLTMQPKRTFKKELTREKLLAITLAYLKQIEKAAARLERMELLEKMVAEIVTAERARLWLAGPEGKRLRNETISPGKTVETDGKKGLLGKGTAAGKALFFNTAYEHKAFDPAVDNIEALELKDLLLFPVADEDGTLLFVIEAATTRHELQQFTDNDTLALDSIAAHLRELCPVLNDQDKPGINDEISSTIETLKKEKEAALRKADSSTQFLAEVAHEIRTPMNAVMGFIDLLKVDEKNAQKLMYLESAAKSGEMMIALINDLLDFSKIEKGMMELEKITFDPIAEFDAMAPLFCARMKKKELVFGLYLDPAMPKAVVSDPHRIKQILSNLIGNAVKFTPEGGQITLEVLYNSRKPSLDFSVIDTGIGIAEANRKKIFEAYAQETDATARKFGGTGLGLSISSRLAEKLGDRLRLESELGKGSRFYFSLPLKDAIVDADRNLDPAPMRTLRPALVFCEAFAASSALIERYLVALGIPPEQIIRFHSLQDALGCNCTHLLVGEKSIDYPKLQALLDQGISLILFKQTAFDFVSETLNGPVGEIECTFGPDKLYNALVHTEPAASMPDEKAQRKKSNRKQKVLVVDDNHLNVHFISEVVKKNGALAEAAYDGKEAVEIYRRMRAWHDAFDLILMDENMPHMNGAEASKLISQIEKEHNYPHTPIIGISGDATEAQRQHAIQSGMDDCIFKPVSVKKLSETLRRFTQNEE